MTQPEEPLPYWTVTSRYQKASWIMLLIMGIISVLMGACVSAAVALILWVPPGRFDTRLIVPAGIIFCLFTFGTASLYLSTSILVKHGSRRGTRVAQITAICTTAIFVILLGVDMAFLFRIPLSNALLPRVIASIALRVLCIAANAVLAWLLTRRLAEMPQATPAPAPADQ